MPELPEVETVVRGLKRLLNQTIQKVVIKDKRSWKNHPASKQASGGTRLEGLRIIGLKRRGKGIIVNLSRGTSLLIHLKMTGQLIYIPRHAELGSASRSRNKFGMTERSFGMTKGRLNLGHPTKDFVGPMPGKHTRVIFKLSPTRSPANPPTRSNTLYFNDQRLFGWIKVLPTKELEKDPFIKKLGPEPFTLAADELYEKIKKRPKSSVKAILLNQSVITGLGNIYTDEVLFEAGIRPTRKGRNITKKDAENLIKTAKKVLKKGIKYSGTSIVNYKTPEGSPGRMQNYLKVYSRNGLPCRKCRTPISKIRVAGRGTHYCPNCQK